ncbi:hypothetical protein FIBSPDRAFT_157605 [Athelia psychrophila]|uniref:Uncharacterized protein n=1 Tax=Athelia psychrophila TaxID=1759441 RepID=A0A166BA75_9AGAM|nr:hypothetical protein FIBSPDRAFT_157605 [Fibularhizoctonia sp. CBS 109695]
MFNQKTRLALLALTTVVFALPAENVTSKPRKLGKRCTGTISSAATVAAAVECTTIVIGKSYFLGRDDGVVVLTVRLQMLLQ